MSIEIRKLRLIEQLMLVNNETTLQRVHEVLKKERIRSYRESLHPMDVEELEEKLEQTEQDVQKGNLYSTEEVRKHFENKKKNG